MLLQRLCDYADRELDLPPSSYQRQAIRYVIDLDCDGRFLGLTDTADPQVPANRRGVTRLAPSFVRTSGIRAKLLVDKGSYVLGYVPPDVAPGREDREHAAFVDLTRSCAAATDDPTVAAVVRFLERIAGDGPPLPADYDAEASITFRVDGVFPIDLPAVQAYWAARQASGDRPDLPCIVCGHVRPALSGHPVPIKPIPNGQTSGNFLISANARAFESYGLTNSLIAPTCAGCAEKYANALNALLRDEATHLRVGAVVFAFWTAEAIGFQPGRLLSVEDETEVRQLLDSYRTGAAAATELEPTAFYAVGLSASGARVAVRSWIDTTVGAAKQRLGRYFALQELVAPDGAPGPPLPLWRLANATVRDPRREAPPATVVDGLVGLALGGTPLPEEALFQAVRRCRAEQGVNRERAALIKMTFGSRTDETDGRNEAMRELDPTNESPAYLCGRLLAILDAIQRRALGNPNATLVDKFYGSASSAPASVFGTLLHNTQNHLAKLRKNPSTQPAQRALEGRLTDVLASLDQFPPTLTLPEQGIFALGYYHQRAEDRRAARERAQQREAEPAADVDAETVDDL